MTEARCGRCALVELQVSDLTSKLDYANSEIKTLAHQISVEIWKDPIWLKGVAIGRIKTLEAKLKICTEALENIATTEDIESREYAKQALSKLREPSN